MPCVAVLYFSLVEIKICVKNIFKKILQTGQKFCSLLIKFSHFVQVMIFTSLISTLIKNLGNPFWLLKGFTNEKGS